MTQQQRRARLIHGEALAALQALPDASLDAVVTDPPYPCIKRPYGYWTEAEWFALMDPVVEQCRRVLKPVGSAVFILQPNSERAGRMRTWLWDFLAKWGRLWNVVQDAYWWNHAALPSGGAPERGLMRPSLKYAAWFGAPDCWRDQGAVLWAESQQNKAARLAGRAGLVTTPSKSRSATEQGRMDLRRIHGAAAARGGTTPFNVLPLPSTESGNKHPGSTPLDVMRWWVRYVCPPGGTVCDPFMGSGTAGVAAIDEGRGFLGMERQFDHFVTACRRIEEAEARRDGTAGELFAGLRAEG